MLVEGRLRDKFETSVFSLLIGLEILQVEKCCCAPSHDEIVEKDLCSFKNGDEQVLCPAVGWSASPRSRPPIFHLAVDTVIQKVNRTAAQKSGVS